MAPGLVVGDHGRVPQAPADPGRRERVGDARLGRRDLDEQVERMARRTAAPPPTAWRMTSSRPASANSSRATTDGSSTAQLARRGDGPGRIGEADDRDRSMRRAAGTRRSRTAVMTARVPSLPARSPAEVVPGVVLRHAGQTTQDGPVGEDRLEAEDLVAHRPMAQDVHAARVGGHHAADGGRVAGTEVDAHLPAGGAQPPPAPMPGSPRHRPSPRLHRRPRRRAHSSAAG